MRCSCSDELCNKDNEAWDMFQKALDKKRECDKQQESQDFSGERNNELTDESYGRKNQLNFWGFIVIVLKVFC